MELISEQEFPDLMNHNANSKEPIGGSVCALSPEKGVYFGPTWGFLTHCRIKQVVEV